MVEMTPLVVRILAAAVPIASHAGKIVRQVLSSGKLGVVQKGVDDPQTEADRAAQSLICKSLRHHFPKLTIIGEEGEDDGGHGFICSDPPDDEVMAANCPPHLKQVAEEELVLWVDPLDGTMEFTQGHVEAVTVLVGMSVAGKVVGGLIHQPFYESKDREYPHSRGRTLWGLVGHSDSAEGGVIGGFQVQSPPQGTQVVVTSRSHSNQMVQAALEALNPDVVLKVGGAGHKVVLLLEGEANAYVYASSGTKKWDTCGPQAVLEAAGGILTDIHGNKYTYEKNEGRPNTQGVLATAPGENHESWVKGIPSEVKKKLLEKGS